VADRVTKRPLFHETAVAQWFATLMPVALAGAAGWGVHQAFQGFDNPTLGPYLTWTQVAVLALMAIPLVQLFRRKIPAEFKVGMAGALDSCYVALMIVAWVSVLARQ
jgi:hypothetical protein